MPEDQGGKTIMFAPWPKPFDADFRDFYGLDDCYLEFVECQIRARHARPQSAARSEHPFEQEGEVHPQAANESLPTHDMAVVKLLLNAESFTVDPHYQPAKGTLSVHTGMGELYMPTEGLIDVVAEIARLKKELEKIQVEIEKVQSKLNNPAFAQKVPPAVLEDHQKRLGDWQAKFAHVEKALSSLRNSYRHLSHPKIPL